MSDQLVGGRVSFPNGSGQNQEASDGGAGNQEPQPNYLTREEAERLAEDKAKAAANEAFQRAQGLFDKGNQKVQARLQEVERTIALNESAGIEVTAEQRNAMTQQAIRDAYQAEDQPNEQSPASDPPPQQNAQDAGDGQDQQVDPINAEAIRIMQSHGVEVNDGDPEVERYLKDTNSMSGFQYLQAVDKAAAEKAARVARNPQARMAGLGSGGPAGGDLEAQYKAELAKIPRGSVQAISQLKSKYRQKGLSVF